MPVKVKAKKVEPKKIEFDKPDLKAALRNKQMMVELSNDINGNSTPTWMDDLNEKEVRLVEEYSKGEHTNLEQLTKRVGYTLATIRVKVTQPKIKNAVRMYQRERFHMSQGYLEHSTIDAVRVLRELMDSADSDGNRIAAAVHIMRFATDNAELRDVLQRMLSIEDKLVNMATEKNNSDHPVLTLGSNDYVSSAESCVICKLSLEDCDCE